MSDDKAFIEVLSEVVRKIIANDDIKIAEKKVIETLVSRGYELSEISDILEKVFNLINMEPNRDLKLRMIHPMELENLTDEAKVYILNLRSNGVLEEAAFEEIMGYASAISGKADVDWVKTMLDSKGIPNEKIIN